MVARDGCVATVSSAQLEAGPTDELRVRCPRPERMRSWFDGVDKLTSSVTFTPGKDEDDDADDGPLPSAEVVTAQGNTLRVVKTNDAQRLLGEVRALAAELAAAEMPAPGPSTPAGWQMLRVAGPAHVYFAGTPTRGVLEARVSTTGQYLCEFNADTSEGPMRATKSGWLSPTIASRAIDEVLKPFEGLGPSDRPRPVFAAGIDAKGERQATVSATAAVFERFGPVQDALGDACVPALDSPVPPPSQL